MTAITHSLRKRFNKDCKLPISLFQDPYFDYFLNLYEEHFGSRTSYIQFCNLVEKLGGEESFFKESKRITDSIIEDISETSEYQEFNTRDLSEYDIKPEIRQYNVYHQQNVDHAYASFDLVKANYNALKFIDPAIVLNTKNYEELLGKYTDEEYFINSKHIRQVIFGHLNPRRQRKIEKFLIHNRVIPEIKKFMTDPSLYISASDDEVVVRFYPLEFLTEEFKAGLNNFKAGIPVRYTSYVLRQLGNKPYFYKQFSMGNNPPVEFKAIPQQYFAECYRVYRNETPTGYDFYTYQDGRVVKYMDPLFEISDPS